MNAEIQYAGEPGFTKPCINAVLRFFQAGEHITNCLILSSNNNHCLLLTIEPGDIVAIKSGFGSGYIGEGSGGFSYVLSVLEKHDVPIDEINVPDNLLERLDHSALNSADMQGINTARRIRPWRWIDYIWEQHRHSADTGTLWQDRSPTIPYPIIDPRLLDNALTFWDDPDSCLLKGYRLLEDILRDRTNHTGHGTKLFAAVFSSNTSSMLTWPDIEDNELEGRRMLFIGTFKAYRNRRAHKVFHSDESSQLEELLLLNHLFKLESQAIDADIDQRTTK